MISDLLSFEKRVMYQERTGILTSRKKKNDKEMFLYNMNIIFKKQGKKSP